MGQRLIGGGVVVLALIGTLVGSVLLGPGEPGRATRAAPPAPPAVGTCIDGFLDPVEVPCSEVHTGEISLSWSAGSPPDPSGYEDIVGTLPYPVDDLADDPQLLCWVASQAYLGLPPSPQAAPSGFTWTTPGVGANAEMIYGPADSALPDWSWSACLFSPAPIGSGSTLGYTGSASGVVADESLPRDAGWRLCSDGPDLWAGLTNCRGSHRFEIVSVGNVNIPGDQPSISAWDDYPDPTALGECIVLADTYLGTPVATHSDTLRATVLLTDASAFRNEQGDWVTAINTVCVVGVDEGSTLTDSLAGLGKGPLPLD